jgi:hypothetical protein
VFVLSEDGKVWRHSSKDRTNPPRATASPDARCCFLGRRARRGSALAAGKRPPMALTLFPAVSEAAKGRRHSCQIRKSPFLIGVRSVFAMTIMHRSYVSLGLLTAVACAGSPPIPDQAPPPSASTLSTAPAETTKPSEFPQAQEPLLRSAPLVAGVTPFPASFHTQMVPTNGTSLYVRVGGKGAAVVLLHGFGFTGDTWAPWGAQLRALDHGGESTGHHNVGYRVPRQVGLGFRQSGARRGIDNV